MKEDMTIYTILMIALYDGAIEEYDAKSFRSLDDAKDHFQKWVGYYRQDAVQDGWVIDTDKDDEFYAYEKEFGSINHYYFEITENTI